MQTLTVNQLVAREVKSAIGHADLRQKDLAQILGITTASISDKLKGKNAFSLEDLLVVAGALGLTLDELLGSSVLCQFSPSLPLPHSQDAVTPPIMTKPPPTLLKLHLPQKPQALTSNSTAPPASPKTP